MSVAEIANHQNTLKGKNTMRTFNIGDDIIDSRDVIERLAELEDMEADAISGDGEALSASEAHELAALRAFADEASCASDWYFGATFIRDEHFQDYARKLVEECEYIPAELPDWITRNIDWQGVADALKVDYADYQLDGVTYWSRA